MASVQSIAEKNNSTVIDRSIAKPNATLRERSDRAVNEFGQVQIKGGTTLDDGFFQSVMNGYANLVNSPLALVAMVVGILGLILEVAQAHGPLQRAANLSATKLNSEAGTTRIIHSFLHLVFKVAAPHSKFLYSAALIWSPYIAKPSKNNMIVSGILSVLVAIHTFPAYDVIFVAQGYLLYTQVRNPKYRLFIFVVVLVLFFIGSEMLKELYGSTDNIDPVVNQQQSGLPAGNRVSRAARTKMMDAVTPPTPLASDPGPGAFN